MHPDCICYSGVEADCTEIADQMLMSSSHQKKNLDFLRRFVDSGVVLSGNCIPYLTGFVPLMGEHFVSCESSAVLFINSVWAGCGNGDGIEASFCAAVCGRTPLWGKHLVSERRGTHLVNLNLSPTGIHEWDLLGHALGSKLPPRAVPVIQGDFKRPNAIQLKSFFAALACAAGTEMCHIIGVTPEAISLEQALGGRQLKDPLLIESKDMNASLQKLSGRSRQKIDYISLGCPHYHVDEIRRVGDFLKNRRIHADTTVHIWTTGSIKYMADRSGYTDIIEKAGAVILTASCPSTRGYPEGVTTAAFDSAKQRTSATKETEATLFYGSREECLKSAISGFWEGR
jgi:predicted aconitase